MITRGNQVHHVPNHSCNKMCFDHIDMLIFTDNFYTGSTILNV